MWYTWLIVGLAYFCMGGLAFAGASKNHVIASLLIVAFFVLMLAIQGLGFEQLFCVQMGAIGVYGAVGIFIINRDVAKQKRIAQQGGVP